MAYTRWFWLLPVLDSIIVVGEFVLGSAMQFFRWLWRRLSCRCRQCERYERDIAYLAEVLEIGYQRELKILYEVERQTRKLRESRQPLEAAVAAMGSKHHTAGVSP